MAALRTNVFSNHENRAAMYINMYVKSKVLKVQRDLSTLDAKVEDSPAGELLDAFLDAKVLSPAPP